MKKIKVLIDTDIGDDIDDAFAIKYALDSEELDVIGITTVFKNVQQRAQMAKKLLKLCDRDDIEVYSGCNNPIREPFEKFVYESAVDGIPQLLSYDDSLKNFKYCSINAADFILETIKKTDGDMVLIAIGPLTNIAEAVRKDPKTFRELKKLVLMNGTTKGFKEWNVMVDPEACKIVYESGVKIDSVGVDITLLTLFTEEELAQAKMLKGNANKYIVKMMDEWYAANKRNPVMHDGLAIEAVISDLIRFESFKVDVLLDDDNRGKMICTKNKNSNIRFAVGLKREEFMKKFFSRIRG